MEKRRLTTEHLEQSLLVSEAAVHTLYEIYDENDVTYMLMKGIQQNAKLIMLHNLNNAEIERIRFELAMDINIQKLIKDSQGT